MLDMNLAKKIIEKVGIYTDYNVNIMDEKGIIIGSKTPNRIGTFHEIAFYIINSEEDMVVTENENNFLGVKEGINMALCCKNKKVGVVGVTGKPGEVRSIAFVIKMAIETMLEFEMYKNGKKQRSNMKEEFLMRLLGHEDIDENKLLIEAEKLGLNSTAIRIPVYISFSDTEDVTVNVMDYIRNSKNYSKQDIMCETKKDSIILYKNLEGNMGDLFQNYKFILGECLSPLLQYLRSLGIGVKFFIGSFQNQLINYHSGYKHCLWLNDNIFAEKNSFYFYDYIDDYFRSLLPMSELNGIYSVFKTLCDQKFIENYVEVIEALYKNNYNSAECSKAMFLHKNTLTYRFNKIRETLGINPMSLSNEREFMNYLSLYFKNIKEYPKNEPIAKSAAIPSGACDLDKQNQVENCS